MLNTIIWWVGAAVCGAGALAAVAFMVAWPVNYAWRKFVDIGTFVAVVLEARRQGRSFWDPAYGINRAKKEESQ